MSKGESKSSHHSLQSLRERAEACLSGTGEDCRDLSKSDLLELIHELHIHQAELEIQNEELRRLQNLMEAERKQYADYFEAAPVGYFVLDENGAVKDVNLTGADLLETERRQIVGRLFSRFVSPSFRFLFYGHLNAAKTKLFRQVCELEMKPLKGDPLAVRLDSTAILKGEKDVCGLRMTMTDISERQRAENGRKTARAETQKQNEENLHLLERFRMVAESTNSAIFICNPVRFIFINTACEKMTGYDRKTLLEMKPVRALRPLDRAPIEERLKESIDQKVQDRKCELTLLTAEGAEKSIEVTINRIIEDGVPALLGTAVDISPHKQSEAEQTRQFDARSMELTNAVHRLEDGVRESAAARDSSPDQNSDQNPDQTKEADILNRKVTDLNTALTVLLQKWDAGRQSLAENVTANLRQVVFPEIEKLKKDLKDPEAQKSILLLEKELQKVCSSFASTLSSRHFGLTPMEIRIASLIKDGFTSDEISIHLNLATKTVSYHRNNIRKKLGIANQKINLQTHLLSLS